MHKTKHNSLKILSAIAITSIVGLFTFTEFKDFLPVSAIYDSIGTPVTNVFNVGDISPGYILGDFDVDSDDSGNQIYAWSEYESGGSCVHYYYRKYNAFGEDLSGNRIPLTGTPSHCNGTAYSGIDVAMDNYGNFVIAYDESDTHAYLEAYNRTNSLRGSRVQIDYINEKSLSLEIKKDAPEHHALFALVFSYPTADGAYVRMNAFSTDFTTNSTPIFQQNESAQTGIWITSSIADVNYIKPKIAFGATVDGGTPTTYALITSQFDRVSFTQKEIHASAVSFIVSGGATYYTISAPLNDSRISEIGKVADNPDIIGFNRNSADTSIDSNYIIAWDGDSDSDTTGIYMRKIGCVSGNCSIANSANSNNSVIVRANTVTSGTQSHPSLTTFTQSNNTVRSGTSEPTANDYFAVSWYDESTTPAQIPVQLFQGNISRLGSPFNITEDANMSTSTNDYTPILSMDIDGDLSAVFKETPGNLKARIYLSEVYKRLNERTETDSGYGNKTASAVYSNGNYATVYNTPDNSGNGIMVAMYDKYGTPINKFLANDDRNSGEQYVGDIAFFNEDLDSPNSGKFIVVWTGEYDEVMNNEVMYRIFNADGTPETATIRVTATTGTYFNAQVSVGTYNEFIIGWVKFNSPNYLVDYSLLHNGITNTGTIPNTSYLNASTNFDITLNPNAIATDNSTVQFAAVWEQTNANPPVSYMREGYYADSGLITFNGVSAIIPTSSTTQANPHIDMLGIGDTNPYYIVTFDAINATLPSINAVVLRTCRLSCPGGGTFPKTFITDFKIRERESGHDEAHYYNNSLAGTVDQTLPNIAKILNTWTSESDTVNPGGTNYFYDIEAQFLKLNTTPSPALELIGPTITVNSSRGSAHEFWQSSSDFHSDPASSENSLALISYTENSPSFISHYQLLNDPFSIGLNQNLQPQVSQEIVNRGKFLSVPTSLNFGDLEQGASVTLDGPIDITDYDGGTALFNLTVSLDGLTNTTNDTITIPKSNFKIRNNDGVNSILPLETFAETTDISIDEADTGTHDAFVDLTSTRTLCEKLNNQTGHWRIYPQYQLTIPAGSEVGSYSGTLTFTIT